MAENGAIPKVKTKRYTVFNILSENILYQMSHKLLIFYYFYFRSDKNSRRLSYIDWDEYFMAIAFLTAKRSKDPSTQVGACIVNDEKRIVGIGYNGMPTGCSDDEFPWNKTSSNPLETKYLYGNPSKISFLQRNKQAIGLQIIELSVCHAEVNAILNKNSSDVKNCTIYVALFPCNECAKVIIQSGIRTIVYMSDKHAHKVETIAAKKMFDAVGVQYRYTNNSDCTHLFLLNSYKYQNVRGSKYVLVLFNIICVLIAMDLFKLKLPRLSHGI